MTGFTVFCSDLVLLSHDVKRNAKAMSTMSVEWIFKCFMFDVTVDNVLRSTWFLRDQKGKQLSQKSWTFSIAEKY